MDREWTCPQIEDADQTQLERATERQGLLRREHQRAVNAVEYVVCERYRSRECGQGAADVELHRVQCRRAVDRRAEVQPQRARRIDVDECAKTGQQLRRRGARAVGVDDDGVVLRRYGSEQLT